jgi:threonine synthase
VAARDASGGLIDKVTDGQILEAYALLARTEGVFCEPASAASVAGLIQLCHRGYFNNLPPGQDTVVCTLTGNGLKDPTTAMTAASEPDAVEANMEQVRAAIGL